MNKERGQRALVRPYRYREAAEPVCLTTRLPVNKRALDTLGRLQTSPRLRKDVLAPQEHDLKAERRGSSPLNRNDPLGYP